MTGPLIDKYLVHVHVGLGARPSLPDDQREVLQGDLATDDLFMQRTNKNEKDMLRHITHVYSLLFCVANYERTGHRSFGHTGAQDALHDANN